MNQHQAHAERGEQVQVVRQVEEAPIADQIAAEGDDEGLAAKSVDIGRDRLKPVDEAVLTRQTLPGYGMRRFARAAARLLVIVAV